MPTNTTSHFGRNLFSVAAAALGFAFATSSARAVIIAQWDFESAAITDASNTATYPNAIAASSGAAMAAASAGGTHTSAGTDWTTPAGNGSANAFSANEWAIGDYFQFTLSTAGYESITIGWDQTRSATGPTDWSLSFSTDGTAFTTMSSYVVNVVSWSPTAGASGSSFSPDLSAFTSLANATTLFLRLGPAVAAGGASGTSRIDNFTISGAASGVSTLYWDPDAGPGIGGTGTWDATSASWNAASDGTGTQQAFTSGSPAIFSGTSGTVTLGAGGVTASGGVTFESGGYLVKSDAAADKLTLATVNTLTVNAPAEISAGIDGSIGLNKAGSGTLTLSGANSFSGNVAISGGTLAIATDAALGNAANDVQLASGTLKASGALALGAGRDFSGSGSIDVSSSASLDIAGSATLSALTLAGNGALTLSGAVRSIGTLTFSGPASLFSTGGALALTGNLATTQTTGTATIAADADFGALNITRTITVAEGAAAADLLISGKLISSGTTGRLHKLGDGTLRLTGDNSGFIGGFRIGTAGEAAPVNGGTVEVTSNKALGTADVQFNAGTLKFTGSFTNPDHFAAGVNLSIGGSSALPVRFTGSGAQFAGGISLFKPTDATAAFRHQINVETATAMIIDGPFGLSTGTGLTSGLSFAGTGAIFFNGATNTVAEPFFIDGPIVGLNGSFPSVNVTVLSGELSAYISTLNDVTIGDDAGSDAAFSASGLGTSTLTVNALSLLSDASFSLLLDSSTQSNDRVIVNTNLSLGSGFASLFLGDAAAVPAVLPLGLSFTLIDAGAGATVSGFFDGYTEQALVPLAPNFFRISYAGGADGHDVTLTVVVPEPGTGALVLAGLLGACNRRRRACRASAG